MHPMTKRLRQKGYTLAALAERWECSKRRISYIVASPKVKDWDAVEGLPEKEE